jgi:hypothetical protein
VTGPQPRGEETSNCIIFALHKWRLCGGYIIIRKSHHGWFPHVIWSKDLVQFQEFHPLSKKTHHWFPPLLFHGYIRYSDVVGQS